MQQDNHNPETIISTSFTVEELRASMFLVDSLFGMPIVEQQPASEQ